MIKVIDVTVLDDYNLLLLFSNGEKRIFDMKPQLHDGFEELLEVSKFEQVKIVHGALTWFRESSYELDICPNVTYDESISFNYVPTYCSN